MKIERFQCDREGCHATSNGNTGNWWSVYTSMVEVSVRRIPDAGQGWKHYCGAEHTLAAVGDAMREMQKP